MKNENYENYQIGLAFLKSLFAFGYSIIACIVVIVMACCDGSSGWAFTITVSMLLSFVYSVYSFFKGLILAIKATK